MTKFGWANNSKENNEKLFNISGLNLAQRNPTIDISSKIFRHYFLKNLRKFKHSVKLYNDSEREKWIFLYEQFFRRLVYSAQHYSSTQ